ncbi:thiamine pyrophosphate-dependent enzyme [Zongyangia sp. HA2173]|uniref:thiamine pyrophosphate-dependent enzyme n=1 Tax=Zongyangia sp. HA2173 TaxID=3133035 RepID=UPI00316A3EB6
MFKIETTANRFIAYGVSACAGCGLELIIRNVLDVLGEDTVVVIPPGCSALFCGFGREAGMRLASFQGNLESTAAYAAGIRAGLAAQGNDHTTVLGFAGDGATVDIGLQSLSGMLERGDRVLYVCYDNEAYMNTGIQGSSSTPYGAWTTTTPGGKATRRKDLLSIVMAHDVPYCASASVAYIPDLRRKVQKAKDAPGPAVLHVHSPCPTGWGCPPAKSIEVCRVAVQCGAWLLYEYENGKITLNQKPKQLRPVSDYVNLQGRFRGMDEQAVAALQAQVTQHYEEMLQKSE